MIDSKDLRKGVFLKANGLHDGAVMSVRYFDDDESLNEYCAPIVYFNESTVGEYLKDCTPIHLSPEVLEKCGFYQLPHFTVQNNWIKDIGRGRFISVACVGTPNEMIFLTEEVPPEVKAVIIIRNYDYDGYTYLHDLQNIVRDFTKTELNFKP